MGKKSRFKKEKPGTAKTAALSRPRLPVWILLIVVLAGTVVMIRTIPYKFVYDDTYQVEKNTWIRSWSNVGRFFTTDVWAFTGHTTKSNYYRPLHMIAYTAAYSIAGLVPYPFHLVNILLHALCCLLVLLIGYRLTENRWISFMGGLLFALHPIHVESVAWIAGVTDPLCAAFYFGALYAYLVSTRPTERMRPFVLSVALYAGALFSKEMAFTFPLLAAYLDLCFHRKLRWSRYAVFAGVFIIYAAMRMSALGAFSIHQGVALPLSLQILSTFVFLARYVAKMFVPYGICAFHVFEPTSSPLDPSFLLSFIFLAGCAALMWKLRRQRTVLFLAGYCFLTIVPVLNLSGIGENAFADRYLYIPTLGSCLLIAILAEFLHRQLASRPLAMSGVRPVTVAVVLCLVAFGWITWRECGVYRDKLTLYHQTMRRSPNASLIAHNLASYYYNIDDLARAEEWETKALAGWQQSYAKNTAGLALIHAGFGNVRFKQGRIDEARDYIMKASQEAPLYDELLQNIGIFYVGVGDYPKALEFFQSAARLNPNLEIAFSNIAGIYAMYDKWDLAIANARKALSINPAHADAWLNLAFACAGKGMKEEARQAYVKLKELDPSRSALVDSELKALSSR